MRNNMVFTNDNDKPRAPDELLKTTSLLYLKEALRKQEFEQCPTLIKTAKRFGATDTEVRKVLKEHAGGPAGRPQGVDPDLGGRLRFLKGE